MIISLKFLKVLPVVKPSIYNVSLGYGEEAVQSHHIAKFAMNYAIERPLVEIALSSDRLMQCKIQTI